MGRQRAYAMISGLPVRLAAVALAACVLAGCERASDLADPPVDLGPFDLGLNIVVADNAQKVPISRDATPDEWERSLSRAVESRFGRYDGDRYYNIGISVDGYALAPPGVPVLVTPKSVLVVTVNVWDDARQQKLNGAGTQFTVFESLSGEQVIGTGITRTKQEQMDALSYNVAKVIENWFLEHPQWFGPGIPVPDPSAEGAAAPAGAVDVNAALATAPQVSAPGTPSVPATPVASAPARAPAAAPAPDAEVAVPAAGGETLPELPAGAIYPDTP
jgi:hypothetical protein